mgnify:CR=1 FL=1
MTEKGSITFRNVQVDDVALNMSIESLNERVFPFTHSTDKLHWLAGHFKGAPVDFVAIEEGLNFRGYAYVINFSKHPSYRYWLFCRSIIIKGWELLSLHIFEKCRGADQLFLLLFPLTLERKTYIFWPEEDTSTSKTDMLTSIFHSPQQVIMNQMYM